MISDGSRRVGLVLGGAGSAAACVSGATVGVLASWTLALAVFAVPAVGESATRSLNFTTGSFVVNCTSSEELCSPAEKLTLSLPRPGTVSAIGYTTAATHCSALLVHVLRNGHQIGKTGRLAAGQQTEHLTTRIALPKGSTTLGFQAQGFVGGCNVGRVGSWGGKITVTVKLPLHH